MKCECGCGKRTALGRKFISGHHNRVKNPMLGKRHSEETKKRWSRIRKGRKLSDEHRKKISISSKGCKSYWKGKHLLEEVKKKISKGNKGKIVSEETRKKLSLLKRGSGNSNFGRVYSNEEKKKFGQPGEKNPNWRGGIQYKPYPSEWNRELKKSILERDNYQCQNPTCRKKNDILNIHHIDYNKENCSLENLITLCNSCNLRANYNRNYWEILYLSMNKLKEAA